MRKVPGIPLENENWIGWIDKNTFLSSVQEFQDQEQIINN